MEAVDCVIISQSESCETLGFHRTLVGIPQEIVE